MIWQKNPFAVAGRLSRCWLIASRVPVAAVQALVPPPFTAAGNLLTDFRFHPARIQVAERGNAVECGVAAREAKSRFRLLRDASVQLAHGSPFASIEEAATFLNYTPIALSPHGSEAVNILRVARDEHAWRTRLLAIEASESQLLQCTGAIAELAFEVEPLDYHWRRGEVAEVQP